MIGVLFTRAPLVEVDEPFANHQPELAGEIVDGRLRLSVYGEGYGLREKLDGRIIPFEGQKTFDELRQLYLDAAGTVFARVTLQHAPMLCLEETLDGWCVLKLGGAEYPHFDGLVGRLEADGFKAEAVVGRSGRDAVAIQVTKGEELGTFKRLMPIITNG